MISFKYKKYVQSTARSPEMEITFSTLEEIILEYVLKNWVGALFWKIRNGFLGSGTACRKVGYSWSAVLHWDAISLPG